MANPASAQPLQLPAAPSPLGRRLAGAFIQGNLFYVLSCALMMLACWLLMRSPLVEGTIFAKAFKTLSILQAYELLVVATAIVIVRSFKSLGDAFTLFVVELALLFDPTFFSNSFATMDGSEGLWVNAACFALAAAKLAILSRALRLKLAPTACAAALFAAAFVYLGEWPMNQESRSFSKAPYLFMLAWLPAAYAVAMPALGLAIAPRASDPRFATPRQSRWLPRFFAAVPLAIMYSHFIQSSRVHLLPLYMQYAAPGLVALAVFYLKNSSPIDRPYRLAPLDALLAAAIIISSGRFNLPLPEYRETPNAMPPFADAYIPPAIAALAAAAVYFAVCLRSRYRPALLRVAAIGGAGAIAFLIKTGAVGVAQRAGNAATVSVGAWIVAHPQAALALVLAAWLPVAWRFRNVFAWGIAGMLAIWLGTGFLPGARSAWIPEIVQLHIALLLALDHRFVRRVQPRGRAAWAFVMACIAMARVSQGGEWWAVAIVAGEATALCLAGWLLREPGYALVGCGQAAAGLGLFGYRERARIDPAIASIAASLAFFAAGVWVTWRKSKIMLALAPLQPERHAQIEPADLPANEDSPAAEDFGSE